MVSDQVTLRAQTASSNTAEASRTCCTAADCTRRNGPAQCQEFFITDHSMSRDGHFLPVGEALRPGLPLPRVRAGHCRRNYLVCTRCDDKYDRQQLPSILTHADVMFRASAADRDTTILAVGKCHVPMSQSSAGQ